MSRFSLLGQAALAANAQRRQTSEPEQFAADQLEAETLLGVGDLPTPLTASLEAVAVLAVCLQINWQLERGIGPLFRQAEGSRVSEKSVTYREDLMRDPRAVALMAQVREGVGLGEGSGYTPVRSLRGGRPTAGTP